MNLTAPDLDRVKTEAQALAHVLNLDPQERPDAVKDLFFAAWGVPCWLREVRRQLETDAPAAMLPALWAMLDRPAMKDERAALGAAGVNLDGLLAVDPQKARQAFDQALADADRAGEARRMDAARRMMELAQDEQDADKRRALLSDAAGELIRAQDAGDVPLAAAWDAHLAHMKDPDAPPDAVLRLHKDRGPWAAWFNNCLGPRGGLEPGGTLIVGGAPEAGKTSLAALLAVDALALGVPVTFWQLELSREETLEHLQAQRVDLDGWPTVDFWGRARSKPLPDTWADLLTLPRWPVPEAESVRDAMLAQARRARKLPHKIKGLVLVDYMQLLSVADKTTRESRFEILEKAASRLSKAAGETGACLVLLSQLNKQDQRDGAAGGVALAGADLARMAHRVALLQKADIDGKAWKPGNDDAAPVWRETDKGEARLLTWTKRRGMRYANGCRPNDNRLLWYAGRGRALHGGEADTVKKGWEA